MAADVDPPVEVLDTTLEECRAIRGGLAAEVREKVATYGPSIRAFRFMSLLDKIHIKILRVRTIRDVGRQAVPDSIEEDIVGVHNYALYAIMRLRHECTADDESDYLADTESFADNYRALCDEAQEIMARKNHDYGAAWKVMAPETIFDEILARVYRIESLAANEDVCARAAQIEDQLFDAANYCLFAILRLAEE
jgi:hypothetical protein